MVVRIKKKKTRYVRWQWWMKCQAKENKGKVVLFEKEKRRDFEERKQVAFTKRVLVIEGSSWLINQLIYY